MPEPRRLTLVTADGPLGNQAIYVDGVLELADDSIYAGELADVAGDEPVRLECLLVEPTGEPWPRGLDDLTIVED